MSIRSIKDATFESASIHKHFKLPTVDLDDLTPHTKGQFTYNIIDDVLYYADGDRWIPLLSGTGNNLIAGFGISITSDGTNVTITNTDPGSAVTLASAGGDQSLVFDGVGPALIVKGLSAGAGITLTDQVTDILITNSSPGSAVTLAGTGAGTTLVNDGVGPALVTKDLIAGTGINFGGSSATQVTINANVDQTTFVSPPTPAIAGSAFIHTWTATGYKVGNIVSIVLTDISAPSAAVNAFALETLPSGFIPAGFVPSLFKTECVSSGATFGGPLALITIEIAGDGSLTISRVLSLASQVTNTDWGAAAGPVFSCPAAFATYI